MLHTDARTLSPAVRLASGCSDVTMVTIALPENFTMLTVGCITDTLRIANRISGRELYRWRTVGATPSVQSSSGISFACDTEFDLNDQTEIAILCGGLDCYAQNNQRKTAWLRQVDRRGATIIAISTGVWTLARTGMLNGRKSAVHWDEVPSFTASFPEVSVSRDIFVFDGRFVTCSGGSATLDMMLALLDHRHGSIFAGKVADLLICSNRRTSNEMQRRVDRQGNATVNIVQKAVALMEKNIENTLTITKISEQVGHSQRQLERKFISSLGVTPKNYYTNIRLSFARKLVIETRISLTEVAIRCGYKSVSQFTKEFRSKYENSPSIFRRRYSLVF